MHASLRKKRFQLLVHRYRDALYSYAVYFLGNTQDAQDVVQEVLVRTWKNLDAIQIGASKTWMFRTTRNLCIDCERRKTARRKYTEPLETVLPCATDSIDHPDVLFDQQELGRQIDLALKQLPPHLRSVIILREIEGLSYKEIAAQLEAPLNTVKVTLMRARQALRQNMETIMKSESTP
ncbi:RNA polymerase sigma factor [candidate division KSB1 bacterium]|nr:RNA polymerase sigma factor [candidate division KSB1 bacterium]